MTPSVQIAGGRRVTRWTCESIIEKIADWNGRYGEPPCSADWNPSLARWRAQEWRAERYYADHWPSTNAVKRAFGGSFDAAVRAAGLEPARPGRRAGSRRARVRAGRRWPRARPSSSGRRSRPGPRPRLRATAPTGPRGPRRAPPRWSGGWPGARGGAGGAGGGRG